MGLIAMYDKALRSAANMLARREHSVFELTRKLQQRDIPPEVIDRVIAVLIADRLLSNERYAESYVRMRSNRGYGPTRIRMEMQERGVEEVLIEEYLDGADVDWFALAREVRERKFGEESPAAFEQRAKQMRFLQYRGFSHAHLNAALKGLDD